MRRIDTTSVVLIILAIILGVLFTYLLIVPALQKNCILDKKYCAKIQFQQADNGQILLISPDGYTYWLTKDFIYAYGDYTGAICPTIYSGTENGTDKKCDLERNGVCLCVNLDCNKYGVCTCRELESRCDVKNIDQSCKCAVFDKVANKCQDPSCDDIIGDKYKSYLSELHSQKCNGAFLTTRNCFNPSVTVPVIYKVECVDTQDILQWATEQMDKNPNLFIYDLNGQKRSVYDGKTYKGEIVAKGFDYTPVFVVNSKTLQLVPGQLRCVENLEKTKQKFAEYPIKTLRVYISDKEDPTMDIYQIVKLLRELNYY